jgi:membrane-associated protein
MSALVERVLDLHGLAVYLTVGLLVLAEDAVFVGFVVPGETAAILGGVAASRGNASVVLLSAIVVVGAIIGDNIGYVLGRRYGGRLLRTRILERRQGRVERAQTFLSEHGGPAVLAGRYIAFLRAVIPFLAGTARLRYSRFLAYNVIGGVTWGVGSVLLGFLAGNSYQRIEKTLGPVTAAVVGLVVVIAVIVWMVRRHLRDRRKDAAAGIGIGDDGDGTGRDAPTSRREESADRDGSVQGERTPGRD